MLFINVTHEYLLIGSTRIVLTRSICHQGIANMIRFEVF